VVIPNLPYEGPDWQTILPPDSPDAALDRSILRLVYGTLPHPDQMALDLARQSDTKWARLLGRWAAIRDVQLQHILEHPGCIPDREERQQWISRLGYATPHILAEAEYARIRREIEPEGEVAADSDRKARNNNTTRGSEPKSGAERIERLEGGEQDVRGN